MWILIVSSILVPVAAFVVMGFIRHVVEASTWPKTFLAAGFDMCSLSLGIVGAIIPDLSMHPAYTCLLPITEIFLATVVLYVSHRMPTVPEGHRSIISAVSGGLAIAFPTVILALRGKG
jgi:hypothetical protein